MSTHHFLHKFPRWMVYLGTCGFAMMLTACSDKPATLASDPVWIYQSQKEKKTVLVFVHGLFGDAKQTWTNKDGIRFFDLIHDKAGLKDPPDIFTYGYTTNMMKSGSLNIQEAADRLHEHMKAQGVMDYKSIVFVAHSMGGLIVMREMLTNRDTLERVPAVMLYGTPQDGAQITNIASLFSSNPGINEMKNKNQNPELQQLDSEWRSLPENKRPVVRCAYEKKPTNGIMVVPMTSSTRFCDDNAMPVSESHLDIVKPDRPGHDSIIVLANTLNEYVNGKMAKLETPDFIKSPSGWVFNLHAPESTQSARLVNTGKGRLDFTVAESDPALHIWPADTPRQLDGGKTETLLFGLGYGAKANEYHFVLRSSVADDQKVTVSIPVMSNLVAKQNKEAREVASDISRLLSEAAGGNSSAESAVKSKSPEAILKAARNRVRLSNPQLGEFEQWIMVAEMMNAINWPGLSALALQHAEKISPQGIKSPSVQRLASVVAAGTGNTKIFSTNINAPVADKTIAAQYRNPLATPAAADVSLNLAGKMQQIPELKSMGLSLKGDVQLAKGDRAGALTSYNAAATISATPSILRRLPDAGAASVTKISEEKKINPIAAGSAAAAVVTSTVVESATTPKKQVATPPKKSPMVSVTKPAQVIGTEISTQPVITHDLSTFVVKSNAEISTGAQQAAQPPNVVFTAPALPQTELPSSVVVKPPSTSVQNILNTDKSVSVITAPQTSKTATPVTSAEIATQPIKPSLPAATTVTAQPAKPAIPVTSTVGARVTNQIEQVPSVKTSPVAPLPAKASNSLQKIPAGAVTPASAPVASSTLQKNVPASASTILKAGTLKIIPSANPLNSEGVQIK